MAEKNVSAISTLMTRLKLEPNNPEAHFNLAVAYEEAGNYDSAINEYERALDLNKNYSRVLLHLGFIQVKKKETVNYDIDKEEQCVKVKIIDKKIFKDTHELL